jgi:RNA 3'-terminal phosphate cyclase (ATP)
MDEVLTLDGAHGEGGGQILRTALSLSMITTRAFHVVDLRAGRRNPGLLPQHLSAVRAAAAVTGAVVSGDRLGSAELLFAPQLAPRAGSYTVDVAETAGRGSAGSVTLILQTLLLPLGLVEGFSRLVLRGGTHVEWSPPFDDVVNAYLPALRRMGFRVEAELKHWGWYPMGGGEVACDVAGVPAPPGKGIFLPQPIEALARGPLRRISGRAVAANLPAHIPQRMADRAHATLSDLGIAVDIEPQQVNAACAGAGIFLSADYEPLAASFSAYGRLGRPSEAVADAVVASLRQHHDSGATVEQHLADQLLLPLAVARAPSAFTIAHPTRHLVTNAWTIGQFGVADIEIEQDTPCRVRVQPRQIRAA